MTPAVGRYDVILSLGCGAGVQAMAQVLPDIHVIPALNTTFLGETREMGLWVENCRACGDCKLDQFADVCPITRCAKNLLNGPCGGSKGGRCEVDPDADCAWQLIIDRLDRSHRLDSIDAIYPPVNWAKKQGKGPRRIVREDQKA